MNAHYSNESIHSLPACCSFKNKNSYKALKNLSLVLRAKNFKNLKKNILLFSLKLNKKLIYSPLQKSKKMNWCCNFRADGEVPEKPNNGFILVESTQYFDENCHLLSLRSLPWKLAFGRNLTRDPDTIWSLFRLKNWLSCREPHVSL